MEVTKSLVIVPPALPVIPKSCPSGAGLLLTQLFEELQFPDPLVQSHGPE